MPKKREAKKRKDEGEKEVISKTKQISVYFSDVNDSNDEPSTSSPTSATSSQSSPSSSCQAPENSPFQTNDDWQGPTSSLSSSIMPQNNPDSITRPPIDPAQWQLNDSVRNYYTYTTNDLPQNIDKIDLRKTAISSGSQNRCLTKSDFSRIMPNGESVNRFWLSFSESTNTIMCIACKLFSQGKSQFPIGYNDWKNVHARIVSHEISTPHQGAISAWISHRGICNLQTSIIDQNHQQYQYWQQVLERVVKMILFLGERGLALRGKDETIGSVHNGNLLGILELLSEYDGFLAKHIERYGDPGTSYLSSTICNEFIDIIGDLMLKKIIQETKESKYYRIIVDSTPDLSHVDQLTFILRYVDLIMVWT